MGVRKQIVKDRSQLANVMAKLEGGKSEISVGDMRQALKLLVAVEAAGYKVGRKSIMTMLRKDAIAMAKKVKKKK